MAYSILSPILMVIPFAYVTSELIFAAISWQRWCSFSRLPHDAHNNLSVVSASSTRASAATERFESVISALSRGGPAEAEGFLRLWFHDRSLLEIQRGNLLDLLAYAFFYAENCADVQAQGHGPLLEQMADRLEALLHPEQHPQHLQHQNHNHQQQQQQSQPSSGPVGPLRSEGAAVDLMAASAPLLDSSGSPSFPPAGNVTSTTRVAGPSQTGQPQPQQHPPPQQQQQQHLHPHPQQEHHHHHGTHLWQGALHTVTARISTAASAASNGLRRILLPGTNPHVRFMAHMTEPLPHFYRPLTFYVTMEAMAWVNHCMLIGAGFRYVPPEPAPPAGATQVTATDGGIDASTCGAAASGSGGGLSGFLSGGSHALGSNAGGPDHYYYVANLPPEHSGAAGAPLSSGDMEMPGGGLVQHGQPTDADGEGSVPIVFLHGVGMGLTPYLRLLIALAATGAPVIAFELKHVSQRWTSGKPPSLHQLAADVVAALRRHGYRQAAVLAHSFGTAVASVLIQSYPDVVRHVTMLDPICFQMYAPRLLRNFIYRRLGAAGVAADSHAVAAAAAATVAANAHAAVAPVATGVTSAGAALAAESKIASAVRSCGDPLGEDWTSRAEADSAVAPSPVPRPAVATATASSLAEGAASPATASSPAEGGPRVRFFEGLRRAATRVVRVALGLPLDLLMLGPARELHCTALLCRRVVWSDINLWEQKVPQNCMVVLSGHDDLMCARSLERWLRDHTSARVVVHPELLHAQICIAWTRQDQILDQMLRDVYSNKACSQYGSGNEAAAAVGATAVPVNAADITSGGEGFGPAPTDAPCVSYPDPDGGSYRSDTTVPYNRSASRAARRCCADGNRQFNDSSDGGNGNISDISSPPASRNPVGTEDYDSDAEVLRHCRYGPHRTTHRSHAAENHGTVDVASSLGDHEGQSVLGHLGCRRRSYLRTAELSSSGEGSPRFGLEPCGGEGVAEGEGGMGAVATGRYGTAGVVRHDSAGSYLRMASIEGLGGEEGGSD